MTDTKIVSVGRKARLSFFAKNSDYAIRALLALARSKGSFLSAREIAKEQNIPYQFLRRILQELIRNKLVISKEGGRGGFKLPAGKEDISVIKIMRIFQGEVQLAKCMFRRELCANRSVCRLRKEIKRIERIVGQELAKVTLRKLLKKLDAAK